MKKNESNTLLRMENIVKTFPGVRALDDVNLDVKKGEIHAICGENGAGKSTLMKVLSGVWPHGSYDGRIVYDGEECRFSNIHQSEQKGIVIIHQELALIPELSIAENMFLGNEIKRHGVIDWEATYHEADKHMKEVGLVESSRTKIKDIGVGKQQLVEIARALAKNVRLLILDEPTAALNEAESAHLLDLMRQQRDQGTTQIIISHKLNELAAVADTITVIRDGKTVDVMEDIQKKGVDENQIIRSMVGRPLDNRFPEHESKIGDVLFEIKDWVVEHPLRPGQLVCKNSTIMVREGEIVGLAGLMGAGRTELARSVFGHSYGNYLSGTTYMRGEPITMTTVREAIAKGVSYLSEDRKALGLNLLDNIYESVIAAKPQKVAQLGILDLLMARRHAEDYRSNLRIKTPSVATNVNTLSGGNQQKVVLAKWMFTDCDILILDEPTRGVDVGAKFEIYTFIQALADEGKGIIVISSELPELLGITDRIYTIFEGEVTGDIPTAHTNQEELMRLMTSSTHDPVDRQ
ncbi:MAG: sugar ABC transporter ATP-binding protein [Actinomycetaceae bacterium]|nr:sugar ABC transporter ATP-binding protein [Actinomycetaceae bacterium]